jgi:hypothetical protein
MIKTVTLLASIQYNGCTLTWIWPRQAIPRTAELIDVTRIDVTRGDADPAKKIIQENFTSTIDRFFNNPAEASR